MLIGRSRRSPTQGCAPREPRGWLYKAWDGEVLVDIIFRAVGQDVDDGLFERAEDLEVNAVPMKVMSLEDIMVPKLLALDEHELDYERSLEFALAPRAHRLARGPPADARLALREGLLHDGRGARRRAPPTYLVLRVSGRCSVAPRRRSWSVGQRRATLDLEQLV